MRKVSQKIIAFVIAFMMTVIAMPVQALFVPYNWPLYPGADEYFDFATTLYVPSGYAQTIPVTLSYSDVKAISTQYASVTLRADGGLDSYAQNERNLGMAPYAFAWVDVTGKTSAQIAATNPPTIDKTNFTHNGVTYQFTAADWFLAGEQNAADDSVLSHILNVYDGINRIERAVDLNDNGVGDTKREQAWKAYATSKRLELGRTYKFFAFRYGGNDLFDTGSGPQGSRNLDNDYVSSYFKLNAAKNGFDNYFNSMASTVITMPGEPTTYTVHFDLQGGNANGDARIINGERIVQGNQAQQPSDPSRTGYTFAGWYTSTDWSQAYNWSAPVNKNLMLYAKWTASVVEQYRVEFVTTTGGTEIADQYVNKNGFAVKPADPTKLGHVFKGWYSDVACTTPFNFNLPITKATRVYAWWEAITTIDYTASFNSNGGTYVPSQTVPTGFPIVRPTNPIKNDYTFVAWYKDTALTQLYDFNTPMTGNITLNAKWIENTQDVFVVTFNSNGGTSVASQSVVKNAKATQPSDPSRTNYVFGGWYLDSGFSNQYNFNSAVTSSFTLYAKWTAPNKVTHTITFDSNGGSSVANQTVIDGDISSRPVTPVKQFHTFGGWYTESSLTNIYEFNQVVNSSFTLYAKWVPELERSQHLTYISGYEDGEVRPNNPITRAEAAMIFFRLLTTNSKNDYVYNKFVDVPSDAWYKQAVTFLSSMGIIAGYAGNEFKPNQPITRAEFATMAARFDNLEATNTNYVDVSPSHWAYPYIASATKKGWIAGYPGNYFDPGANITRAEVVTLVNRMLNRAVEKGNIPSWAKYFKDLSTNHWAYEAIIEASTPHNYNLVDNREIWSPK